MRNNVLFTGDWCQRNPDQTIGPSSLATAIWPQNSHNRTNRTSMPGEELPPVSGNVRF
jgi:hypothetical protein